jgi:hypothetical protein
MPDAYLVAWAQDRVKLLAREVGRPVRVLYGSPHQSAPSLRRYGISTGDTVFIVGQKQGVVSILSRVRVKVVVSAQDFFREGLKLPSKDLALAEDHLWALEDKLRGERPELGHQLPFGCVDEAAIPTDATPIRTDQIIPPKVLGAIRLRDARGRERALPVENGRLQKPMSIQGHYFRLVPASAALLDAVVDG